MDKNKNLPFRTEDVQYQKGDRIGDDPFKSIQKEYKAKYGKSISIAELKAFKTDYVEGTQKSIAPGSTEQRLANLLWGID